MPVPKPHDEFINSAKSTFTVLFKTWKCISLLRQSNRGQRPLCAIIIWGICYTLERAKICGLCYSMENTI